MIQSEKIQPLCPVFNECGGCLYQDIPYTDELNIKEQQLKDKLKAVIDIQDEQFDEIVASPKPYHYRNRLDLRLLKTKEQKVFIGFSPKDRFGVVPVDQCPIAEEAISQFIPQLKVEAQERLPAKYRLANLVVRTGDDGRVFWGGIGKRSLHLEQKDYLWTEIEGRKIYYSLDTFFQANLSILPKLFTKIRSIPIWNDQTNFFDLYGGVGLFGIFLWDLVKKVYLIEENIHSVRVGQYNIVHHNLKNFDLCYGTVEEHLPELLQICQGQNNVAMIDPPRAGLSAQAIDLIVQAEHLNYILYLSCNPDALAENLKEFQTKGLSIERIMPFDFFPKTKHLETLVLIKKG